MRIGSKGRPFYRIVAVDERRKRTGGYLELLGTYNPLTEPKEVKIDETKLGEWKKKGAVLSDGFLRIIGEAKQKQPRKPKKDKNEPAKPEVKETPAPATEESVESEAEVAAEVPVETPNEPETTEQSADETPVTESEDTKEASEDSAEENKE